MFDIKNIEAFTTNVIPQYFGHSKFASFSRQLCFYGFTKIQRKSLKLSDVDPSTADHLTFYNENFKRGRIDLIRKIKRKTTSNSTGGAAGKEYFTKLTAATKKHIDSLQKEVHDLKDEGKCLRRQLLGITNLTERIVILEKQLGMYKRHDN